MGEAKAAFRDPGTVLCGDGEGGAGEVAHVVHVHDFPESWLSARLQPGGLRGPEEGADTVGQPDVRQAMAWPPLLLRQLARGREGDLGLDRVTAAAAEAVDEAAGVECECGGGAAELDSPLRVDASVGVQ